MKYSVILLTVSLLLAGCGNTVSVDNTDVDTQQPNHLNNPFQTVLVTGRTVNLRQGPGTQYAIVGSVNAGDSLMVTGEAPDWYRIYLPDNSLFAWIYAGLTSGAALPQ